MILAIVDDLIFRGKMEAAAKQVGAALTVARDAEAALRAARLRRPALPSPTHLPVGTRARSQALEAGCTAVLPRSAFVQQLPELLSVETPPNIPE